ncbi:MAG TPA: hypothetical protein GX707_10110 [Epulopiscium sp.]|nr:hypothetical protein [Candidatus Epulonipiscium sp.]
MPNSIYNEETGKLSFDTDHFSQFAPNSPLQVTDTFTFLDRVLLLNGATEMRLPRSVVEKYITNKEHWAFANMASVASKLCVERVTGGFCFDETKQIRLR